MKKSDLERLKIDVQMVQRDLNIMLEKLQRQVGTQFEPNITEIKRIKSKVKTIRGKASELTQV